MMVLRSDDSISLVSPRMHVPQDIDELLRSAISQRRQIRFWYGGKERVAEPHDYGIQNGAVRLLAYQTGGHSSSGRLPAWRLVDVAGITKLEILDRTFGGSRPAPSGKHHRWDEILLRVNGE